MRDDCKDQAKEAESQEIYNQSADFNHRKLFKTVKTKPKTVKISELSTIKMTCGNEKKYHTVVHDGIRKEWVGFGWVDEGKATAADKKRYPTVV